jgi:hypothetical protein
MTTNLTALKLVRENAPVTSASFASLMWPEHGAWTRRAARLLNELTRAGLLSRTRPKSGSTSYRLSMKGLTTILKGDGKSGDDCAWCGGEIFEPHPNKRGEVFCSKNHRTASNRALKRLLERTGP